MKMSNEKMQNPNARAERAGTVMSPNAPVRSIKQIGRKDKESGQRPRKRLYSCGRGEGTVTNDMGTIYFEVTFIADTGSFL